MIINIPESPYDFARSLPKKELRTLIRECKKALALGYDEWLDRCRICFEKYATGDEEQARWWSNHANLVRPEE